MGRRAASGIWLALLVGTVGCYEGMPADQGGGSEGDGDGGDESGGADDDGPETDDDVGRVALHRLTRAEYDNTLHDLMGADMGAADFIRGGTGVGFANQADLLRDIPLDLVEGYVDHAEAVGEQVAADPALLARMTGCTEAEGTDCLQTDLASFGLKAWRRPLSDAEVTRLIAGYTDARSEGRTHAEALGHVLAILIASPYFVFHIEYDDDPEDPTPHRVDGYALASRLSYMLWSSLPDDALFADAASDALLDDETLLAHVDRMLDDPRADRFRGAFLEEWLHVPLLDSQSQLIDPEAYPDWTPALGDDMRAELSAYLDAFVDEGRPWSEFLTADLNFVTPELAEHYGMPFPDGGGALARVEDHPDPRIGFLGLAGFLTYTSRADRTSPTLRGKIVLESLQCTTLTIPGDIPPLDDTDGGQTEFPSIRERLEAHRAAPDCAACHDLLDPIGLTLENFDGVGAWRETYEDGYPIDATTDYQGETIDGLLQLAPRISAQPNFLQCPPQKLFAYALRRVPRTDDRGFIVRADADWETGSIRALVRLVVGSDAFRFRRGPLDEQGN